MATFIGGINGTTNVRPPSRGYKYTYQYEKYYIGQLKNVKTLDDHFKWTLIVLDSLKKGHLSKDQFENVLEAGRKKSISLSKRKR